MSIANELSSEVAAAVLTRKHDEAFINTNDLVEIVVEVHDILRHLTVEARRKNRFQSSSELPRSISSSSSAAAGSH